MSQINSKKNILPFLAAIVVFLVFSCLYFMPLLQGKILMQSDIVNYIGTSKEAVDYYNTSGKPALWTNSMFSGMPTYQVVLPDNGNVFETVNKYLGLMLPRPANYMFIALLAFFVLLRSFRINYFLSISGALCYALGTYLITFMEAGHNTKVNALALLPFIMAGINYLLQQRFWLGATLTLFGITCQITANHPQITYYTFLIIACWMISECIIAFREKKLPAFFKTAAVIILSVVLAVSANTTKLWTTYEYSKETIRGGSIITKPDVNQTSGLDRDYAFGWSSGVAESFSIMYPDFAGGGSGHSFLQDKKGEMTEGPILSYLQSVNQQDPKKAQELLRYSGQATKYWGDMPFTSGPIYVGSILCFLFLLGAFLADNRTKWWLIAATILSLFLGWGKNFPAFNNFMFDHFPMYNKFRTVSMAMTMLCLTIPILAFYITDRFLSSDNGIDDAKKRYALKWTSVIVGSVSLILMLLSSSLFDLLSPAESAYLAQVHDPQSVAFFELIKDARASMIRSDVLLTVFFIGLSALTLYLFLKKTFNKKIAVAVLCFLPVLDLLIVDSNYIGKNNFVESDYYEKRFRQSNPVINDKDPDYRVFNTIPDVDKDGSTSYYYKSIGGYHGAKLQRYQDIIDYLNKGNMGVVNMLNAKYFISNRGNKMAVDRNPMALGNAWFVDSVQMVQTPDEEYNGLAGLDPGHKALVHTEFKSQIPQQQLTKDSTASIVLKKYSPDEMVYSSVNANDGAAIFSEIWYRGNQDWKAYIDGKYVDHFRANYLLRGLWVPKGEHEIVFKFEPNSFYTGKKVSSIASSFILLLVAAGFFMTYRKSAGAISSEEIKQP